MFMRTKKGMILLQVLVMTSVFMFISVTLVKYSLEGVMLKNKCIVKEAAASDMEGTVAKIWACLGDAGYPPANDCAPATTQEACVPSGTSVEFLGTYPACRIRVSVDK